MTIFRFKFITFTVVENRSVSHSRVIVMCSYNVTLISKICLETAFVLYTIFTIKQMIQTCLYHICLFLSHGLNVLTHSDC